VGSEGGISSHWADIQGACGPNHQDRAATSRTDLSDPATMSGDKAQKRRRVLFGHGRDMNGMTDRGETKATISKESKPLVERPHMRGRSGCQRCALGSSKARKRRSTIMLCAALLKGGLAPPHMAGVRRQTTRLRPVRGVTVERKNAELCRVGACGRACICVRNPSSRQSGAQRTLTDLALTELKLAEADM